MELCWCKKVRSSGCTLDTVSSGLVVVVANTWVAVNTVNTVVAVTLQ